MMPAGRVTVLVRDSEWRNAAIDLRFLRRAANLSLLRARCVSNVGALTILLTNDGQLRALNEKFRGKDVPTNVLSFPSAPGTKDYLGDVAIAYGLAAREAAVAGKPLGQHAAHLAVHGVLHLLGYDHETPREAGIMEPLESAILGEMEIADPYARIDRRMIAQ